MTCISDEVFVAQPISTPTTDLAGTDSGLGIYPNPVAEYMVLELDGRVEQNAVVQIVDPLGRIIPMPGIRLHQGRNQVQASVPVNLPAGLYRLVVSAEGAVWQASFVKG